MVWGSTSTMGILANFHLVYIFTIGTYFVTASLERIVDLVREIFTLRLTVSQFSISFLLFPSIPEWDARASRARMIVSQSRKPRPIL